MPEVDVLVVGAGPVGLAAAHELVRRGVRVRLVDKADGPAATSRASATHARTLELYHQMGVLDEILPRGIRAGSFSIHRNGRRLIRFGTDYTELPTRFPFTLQVDQAITEEVLRDSLLRYGVKVEWGIELDRLEQHPGHADAVLRTADGRTDTVSVPWLVGTDGAHSTVRKELDLRLLGDSSERWSIADAVIDVDLPKDGLHLMHTPKGAILLVPFPARGKWRLLDTTAEAHDANADPDAVAARFSVLIGQALGRPAKVERPTWVSVFTIQQRMIQQMRVGRCFLAGDAAHVHSPASGQGMNTGIQDAVNLAWKLADVVRGYADEKLLDSYSVERVPVGEALLGSTKKATALIALRNALAPLLLPVGLGLLNLLKPAKRKAERKMMKTISALGLNYRDSPLNRSASGSLEGIRPGHRVGCTEEAEKSSAGWRALCSEELVDPRWTLLLFGGDRSLAEHAVRRYGAAVSVRAVSASPDSPYALADPDGRLASEIGARPGDYVLIRPDAYLAGKGPVTGTAGLDAVLNGVHLHSQPAAAGR
ncbi:FAD-dependent oxidoreductase [Amycolatopsis sp. NPDC059090]|uniref:FAD-dependent oxidoreductase n=1 Tax=unclassified Amycolatopsis TaxID=2618356 RepID=UPI00366F9A5F